MKNSSSPKPIDDSTKADYLSNAKLVTVGVVLILMGVSLTLIPADWSGSV